MNARNSTLTEKATAAMRSAVRKVVEEHQRHERPLAVWEGNRVVRKMPGSVLVVRESRETYQSSVKKKSEKNAE